MQLFTIDLHRIVRTRKRNERELLPNYHIWWIGTAVCYNDDCYTFLSADNIIVVEDTPTEILEKIKRSVELSTALTEYKYGSDSLHYRSFDKRVCEYANKFRVFNDWQKSILINLEFLKYAEPISKFQTKLVYGKNKQNIIIHLPIKLLDIPCHKIRLPR